VRLLHGKAEHETVYFENPLEAAEKWIGEGASWLHVVDLDGAFTGKPTHLEVIAQIANLGCRVQLGGGMRNEEVVEQALAAGASRVVLGTSAVEKPGFVADAIRRFGSDAIAVGLDARDGQLALRGWIEGSGVETLDFARMLEDTGVETVIHTDIATDGALTGPNLTRQAELAESCGLSIIASGGVSSLADVESLVALGQKYDNLSGVIVGRALYEGRVSVKEMLEAVGSADDPSAG